MTAAPTIEPLFGQFSDDFKSVVLGYEADGGVRVRTISLEGMDGSFDQPEVMHGVICRHSEFLEGLQEFGAYPTDTAAPL